jgi:hypothetical protein
MIDVRGPEELKRCNVKVKKLVYGEIMTLTQNPPPFRNRIPADTPPEWRWCR